MLYNETLIDFDIIEILLITTIAFIGAFVHRFWEFVSHNHPITVRTWICIFINMIIVTIISLILSPMMGIIHSRMILLPPLLMGLAGEELTNLLVHIDSSTRLLDWFLRLFKIRTTPLEHPPDKDNRLEEIRNGHRQLLEKIIKVDNKMNLALHDYTTTSNHTILLTCYREVVYDISMIELDYNKWQDSLDKVIVKYYQNMLDSYKILVDLKNKYDEKIKSDLNDTKI